MFAREKKPRSGQRKRPKGGKKMWPKGWKRKRLERRKGKKERYVYMFYF